MYPTYMNRTNPVSKKWSTSKPKFFFFRTKGFGGLYLGLRSKLAQMILTAALMFLFYEKITAVVFTAMQVDLHNDPHVS